MKIISLVVIRSLNVFLFIESIYLGTVWFFHDEISSFMSEMKANPILNQKLFYISLIPIFIPLMVLMVAVIRKRKDWIIGAIAGGLLSFIFIRFKVLYLILSSLGIVIESGKFLLIFLSLFSLVLAAVLFFRNAFFSPESRVRDPDA